MKSYTTVFFDGVDAFTRTDIFESEKELRNYYKKFGDCEILKVVENFEYDTYDKMVDGLIELMKNNHYGKLEMDYVRRMLEK